MKTLIQMGGDEHKAHRNIVNPLVRGGQPRRRGLPRSGDRLDVTRDNAAGHVAFGFGRHFCLGSHLARLEI